MQGDVLQKLHEVLLARKSADGTKSYVASLYSKGTLHIAEKILEEAQELIDEALKLDQEPENSKTREAFRQESADLLFHWLVLLAHHDIAPKDVLAILESRMGVSGHDEKASRLPKG